MIVCEYTELSKYQVLLPNLRKVLEFVEQLRKQGFPDGRHEYDGGFLFVQRGKTKPFESKAYEAHRRYIDVQYMVSGGEEVYYEPLTDLKVYKEYEEGGDIAFYAKEGKPGSCIHVREGMCWIAFPSDGHMPCRCTAEAENYLKLVIKLPYE